MKGRRETADAPARFMRRAMILARRGEGWTSPNPLVGAIVVRKGEIVAEGWHRRLGAEHAEVMALRRAGRRARDATLFVTLEPCNHAGLTPPCTEAVIASGIARVVIGMNDPNTRVRGGGARKLRAAGIEVIRGALGAECRLLNAPFVKHVETGLPLVTLKMAMSLDGKVTSGPGQREVLSGPEAARFVHGLRHAADAILVGVRTVLVDDPLLTTRRTGAQGRPAQGKDPLRVILDSRLRTPPEARLLHSGSSAGTIIVTMRGAPRERERRLRKAGAEVWRLPARGKGVSLRRTLRALGDRGVQSLLIEGGPSVASSVLAEKVADRLILVIAPRFIGGDGTPGLLARALEKRLALEGLRLGRLGADILLQAELGTGRRQGGGFRC